MSLQNDKYDVDYWDAMVDDGKRFVSAKSMIGYIITIGIIIQSISLMMTPTNWLIWNAIGFIIATNLGAVVLAVKAQSSAERISAMTSEAFSSDFYHTMFLITELKSKVAEEAANDGIKLKEEIGELGVDVYSVIKGYLKTYSKHMATEVDLAESKEIEYSHESELFNE